MALLAAVPSVSVMAVTARAAAHGFRHGLATTAGIVAGDLVFVLVALFGLALLAAALGPYAVVIRYLGAAYVIALGVLLWRGGAARNASAPPVGASLAASFAAGLLITLGDAKAVLFYLGFFPAVVELARLKAGDIALIALIVVLAVGGVKLAYAGAAAHVGRRVGPRAQLLQRVAAATLVGAGLLALVGA